MPVRQADPDFDPWLDNDFSALDTRNSGTIADRLMEVATPEETAVISAQEAAMHVVPEHSEEERPLEIPAEVVAEGPEVLKYEDGSSVTIEKTATGLKATLDPGNGAGKESFYGKTESELLRQVLPAKLNATKKIREQTRQIKQGVRKTDEPKPVARPALRELTADEKFQIKTQLAADPDLAMAEWFQKKTGLSIEQLVKMAQEGKGAAESISIDTESKAFIQEHPEYFISEYNFRTMLSYLAQTKLGVSVTRENQDRVVDDLADKGLYTRVTLGEAFEELTEAGLLQKKPEATQAPEPVVVPAPETKAPPAVDSGRKVQTRATSISYGLRANTSSPKPSSAEVPSVEDLENASTEEINELMQGVIRLRAQRSNPR